ncbi:MAG: GNAT family N-acetyltransferase [Gemmatimonadetes bacterium]|nr:GNAT family N-acetyltransferase [Gemmatimonadota bacterium]
MRGALRLPQRPNAGHQGLKIVEEPVARLAEHGHVPIAYEVRSRFRADQVDGGLGGIALVEEPVDPPYVKDYDQTSEEGPARWPARWLDRWDTSAWGLLAAYDGSRRIGGALLARRTPNVNMLEGRDDLLVLWDLRVHPDHRGAGVGRKLFEAAVEWGQRHGCVEIKIETQNTNVPACRFYARQGCRLGAIISNAYEEFPDELQLIWRMPL